MVRLVILRLLESFFRRWWLYLLPAVLMLAVGGVYVALQPPTYYSQATLFIENDSLLASLTETQGDFSWRRSPAQQVISDFRELFQTDAFVRSAIQQTKLEPYLSQGPTSFEAALTFFRESVKLRAAGNNLLAISAETEDPELSKQLVDASIEAFVAWKINSQYQESTAAQAFFANLILPYEEELQRARDALTIYLATYPEPIRGERPIEEQLELQRLQSAVNEASTMLNDARGKEESARLVLAKAESVIRQTYLLIDAAQVPLDSNSSLRAMAIQVVLFGAIGAVLSVIGVIGGAVLDRSLRVSIDVRQLLHLPVLAVVPTREIAPSKAAAAQAQGAKGAEREPAAQPMAGPLVQASSAGGAEGASPASTRRPAAS